MPKDKELVPNPVGSMTSASNHGSVFLARWADNHKSTFEDCMERLADEMPHKYCDLYLKIATLNNAVPQNKTNIENINVNVHEKLDALGGITDTSWRNDGQQYTRYEEVPNEK